MNALKTLPLAALLLLLSGCAALPYAMMAASSVAQAEQARQERQAHEEREALYEQQRRQDEQRRQQQQRALMAEGDRLRKQAEELERANEARHQQYIQAMQEDWARQQREAAEQRLEQRLSPVMLAVRSKLQDAQTIAHTAIDPELMGPKLAGHREARAMYVVFNLAHRRREAQLAKERAQAEREMRRYERSLRSQRRSSGGWGGGGKVCVKGCPCGRSCISCKKTCHK